MKNKFNKFPLIIISTLVFLVAFACSSEVKQEPGILAPNDPIQRKVTNGNSWIKDEYTFTKLADFEIEARILGKESYSHDKESDISPYDLALGWGRMSDQSVIEKLKISQSNRWYHWRTDVYPIPKREIETHSANMHMIPSNDEIEQQLDNLVVGNVIKLKGSLVKVTTSDGWRWISSLTRNDTGGGACEVVWIDELETKL